MSRRRRRSRSQKRLLKTIKEFENGRSGLFAAWPRPASQRTLFERVLRKVWLFRWDRHEKSFRLTGIEWCQSKGYRDEKVARYFPVRNWIQEELPAFFRSIGYRWERLKRTVEYRLPPNRYHVVKARTLKPGYYEVGTRMLHTTFQLITDFVEVSLARRYSCNEDESEPLWFKGRSPEAGLRYLNWEINDTQCQMGSGLTQAGAAQIKRDLYLWWTVDRPARMEPIDVYTMLRKDDTADKRFKKRGLWGVLNGNDDMRPNHCYHALEAFYQKEDQEMLEKAASIMAYF